MNRRCLLTLVSLVVSLPLYGLETELAAIAQSTADTLEKAAKTKVAVVDFTDIEGNPNQLGRFLAEELSVALVSIAKGFEVIDRLHMQTILDESELSRAGVFEREATKKLLSLAGVDALVTGRLTPLGAQVRVAVKVLDTETARLLGGLSVSLERDASINELLARSVTSVTSATPTPDAFRSAAIPLQTKSRHPVTMSVQAVRVHESSVQVILFVRNDTDTPLEWGERDCAQLSDTAGNVFRCSRNPKTLKSGEAARIGARGELEVTMPFVVQPKPSQGGGGIRYKGSRIGTQRQTEPTTLGSHFTLSLDYEYRESPSGRRQRSSVVFADLPGERLGN